MKADGSTPAISARAFNKARLSMFAFLFLLLRACVGHAPTVSVLDLRPGLALLATPKTLRVCPITHGL